MKLKVIRYHSTEDYTLGMLLNVSKGVEFLAYTLEDEHRDVKVKGETRIPAGRYQVTLRTEGGFHSKYSEKYKEMHKGMLWLRDVPGFEYILIHTGNTDEHTAGCLFISAAWFLTRQLRLMNSPGRLPPALVLVSLPVLFQEPLRWLRPDEYPAYAKYFLGYLRDLSRFLPE